MIIEYLDKIPESRKTILFDRDGTINSDSGHTSHPTYPEITAQFKAIAKSLRNTNVNFGIITNQSGIAKKKFSLQDLFTFNQNLLKEMETIGVKASFIIMCPHQLSDDCLCRKPKSLMLEIALILNQISTSEAIFIGNSEVDSQAAVNVGMEYLDINDPQTAEILETWISK
jgi:D-glycero-D-manno-heptose 1,7-bisphosphate phosphatase